MTHCGRRIVDLFVTSDHTTGTVGVHLGYTSHQYGHVEIVSNVATDGGWIDFKSTSGDFSERIRSGVGDLKFYTSGTARLTIQQSIVGAGNTFNTYGYSNVSRYNIITGNSNKNRCCTWRSTYVHKY
jgi:hypothetical protein